MYLSDNKLNLFIKLLITILPISILVGPSASILNIALISIIGATICFIHKKNYNLFGSEIVKLLAVLYLYLIFNTFISLNFEESINRNLGFFRYIFLFIAINYFFFKEKNINFFFKIWLLVFLVVFFDIFFEFYMGKNILGYPSLKNRIGSFFKDEAVIGSFLNGFIFILIGYLFKNLEKNTFYQNILIFSFIFVGCVSIIFTGERASAIKFFLGMFLFFFMIRKTKYIYLITILASLMILLSANFGQYKVLKTRFYDDIFPRLMNSEIRQNYLYFQLYSSGIEVFKSYPFFGVGNKNYRVETCKTRAFPVKKKENEKYKCNTHPHQVYIEFLSEHGLIGTILILYIFIKLIFLNFKNIYNNRNSIQIGCFCFLSTNFIPFIPSGSFFSDFSSTFFFINLSMLYAVSSKTNIFKKIDNF